MKILISGGAKSGKSSLAQDLALRLANGGKHYYVATLIPCDEEDRQRIRRHLADRAEMGFETIECGTDILRCLDQADPNATFLLDSTTALLTNALFPIGSNGVMDEEGAERCAEDLLTFFQTVANAVVVSDFIFSDAVRYDAGTEFFRKRLADIDRRLATASDTVLEATAGNLTIHKGGLPR